MAEVIHSIENQHIRGRDIPWRERGLIFVCRQMYNTSEGLQVLRPYGLHACLQPGKRVVWEETLLNLNLLIFSATPKGLLLLQHTGAITEGVTYMFSRFTKKLQTRPCVKFGYGVMVTQVAATVPGVVALHSSGFVQAIMAELWSDLECGREDVRVVHPKSSHMDFIDRSCLKPLPNKAEYNLREMPISITT